MRPDAVFLEVERFDRIAGAKGDLSKRTSAPRPPLPAIAAVWNDAGTAAVDFWNRASADERISANFRALAVRCGVHVTGLLKRFG